MGGMDVRTFSSSSLTYLNENDQIVGGEDNTTKGKDVQFSTRDSVDAITTMYVNRHKIGTNVIPKALSLVSKDLASKKYRVQSRAR